MLHWMLLPSALVAPPLAAPRTATPLALAPSRLASPRMAAEEEVDVVVIGSGLGGLSCAALLASRGLKTAVLEQHYEIGGCAHEFSVNMQGRPVPTELLRRKPEPVFKFEAGPSLYSGLSPDASPNPLKVWNTAHTAHTAHTSHTSHPRLSRSTSTR